VHTLWLLLLLLLFRYILSPSRSSAEERSSNTKRTKRERDFAIPIYQSYEARVYTAFNLRRRHVFFVPEKFSLSRTRTKRELTKKETARRGRIHRRTTNSKKMRRLPSSSARRLEVVVYAVNVTPSVPPRPVTTSSTSSSTR